VVGIAANAVLGLAFGVAISRALGAAGAGAFFAVVALFSIAEGIARLGADTGLIREVARYQALGLPGCTRIALRVGVWPVALASGGLAAAMFVGAAPLGELIAHERSAEVTGYIRILAPFLPLASISSVLLAATRGFGSMLPFVAVERIGRALLRLLLAAVMLALGAGATALMVAWAVPLALGCVAAALWLERLARTAAPPSAARSGGLPQVAREFWSFSSLRGVAATLRVGIIWLDLLLVAALGSERDAGIYNAASRLVAAGTFALQAVLIVIGPQVSELLARGERGRVQRIYQLSSAWLTALSFPFYVAAAAFAPLLLRTFGPGFEAGATAVAILSLAMLLDMATGPVQTVLLMAGKSSWNLLSMAATLVVNAALLLLLIPPLGLEGAAIAWLASIVVQNAIPLVQLWHVLGLHPFSRSLLAAALGSLACFGLPALIATALLGQTIPALLLFALVALATYAAFLVRFRSALALDAVPGLPRLRRRVPARYASPGAVG
jgi:O-antigen/teichoic acid export membrane protein